MQPMLVGALLALSAHQTEAMWGPNTWWGWRPSGVAQTTAGTAPAAKEWGWGWNWGSWGWGGKAAGSGLWGSCPQGQWQWRTGCRAIPECAPGQAWKGWVSGCCKNDCPAGQTWDPRTGSCCAVPSCPAGQAWKGWARGCCADNNTSGGNVVLLNRPVPAPAPAAPAQDGEDISGEDIDLSNDDTPSAVAPPPAPAPAPIQPYSAPAQNSEEVGEFVDDAEGLAEDAPANDAELKQDQGIIVDDSNNIQGSDITPLVPNTDVTPMIPNQQQQPSMPIVGNDPISWGPGNQPQVVAQPQQPAPVANAPQAQPTIEDTPVEGDLSMDGQGELAVDGQGEDYPGEGSQ
eukprot:comp23682_c1_seq1/m.40575 comp23682_c1_seq1/g.40575  ORF comp23682_c1_seq1/g.40575 comp23682_c1_seq1/m.40575 type:complete len:345 (-) comp23682_c1_seq1:497-1531(-)